jgi:CheY-like chemotaxis protein
MGLQGDLEDIPLLDILQIIAFSRKTGLLAVDGGEGTATLVFREGRVIAAVEKAGGAAPAAPAALDVAARQRWARERIEAAVARLARLRDGAFRFELVAEPPARVDGTDVAPLLLADGINPEELLLELARGLDEGRRDAQAAVESGAADAADDLALVADVSPTGDDDEDMLPFPEPEPPPALVAAADRHRIVLLVDDEDDLRATLAARLVEGGCQVVEAACADAAVKTAEGLAEAGLPFVLVLDRGMPDSDSSSFDGGLEVMKRLRRAGQAPPVLLMTDRVTASLQSRARRLGITRLVFKPGLSRLDPGQFEADLRAFAALLLRDFLPELDRMAGAVLEPPSSAYVALPRAVESWDDFATLQRRLEELDTPTDALDVARLVMKAAPDFFERGLLLLVKDDALRGLQGFGGPAEGGHAVRGLSVPLGEPSLLADAVASGRPVHGPFPEEEGSRLADALGGPLSADAALLPLVANRETIALLVGSNPEGRSPRRPLELLEVFLRQAGVALEGIFFRQALAARLSADAASPARSGTASAA